jgi:hypothetical protein
MNKPLLLLPLIVLSLLAAIWAGWLRIGWAFPATAAAAQHGALMVGSFLASLIFLERAVTFSNQLMLLLPAVNAASGLFFLLGQPVAAQWCLATGSLGFVGLCSYFIYKYRELYYYVFLGGALALFIGNLILLRKTSYPHAVPWWMAFLLFTIVAERLELNRFLALTKAKTYLVDCRIVCYLPHAFNSGGLGQRCFCRFAGADSALAAEVRYGAALGKSSGTAPLFGAAAPHRLCVVAADGAPDFLKSPY